MNPLDDQSRECTITQNTRFKYENIESSEHPYALNHCILNSYEDNLIVMKNQCIPRPDIDMAAGYHFSMFEPHARTMNTHSQSINTNSDIGMTIDTNLDFRGPFVSNFTPHDILSERNNLPCHVIRTRRRKGNLLDEARICVVCGETASGYNFDRLTCESCKAFFRRNALKPREKIKACSRNADCDIEGSQRKHCPSCRLEKCLAVGMKKELILPPEKLEQRAKPKRRKQSTDDGSVSSGCGMTCELACGSAANLQTPPLTPTHSLSGGNPRLSHQTETLPENTNLTTVVSQLLHCKPHLLEDSILPQSPKCTAPMSGISAVTSCPIPPHQMDPCFCVDSRGSCYIGGQNSATPQSVTAGGTDQGGMELTPLTALTQREYPSTGGRCQVEPSSGPVSLTHLEAPDAQLLACLAECIQRIREPFTPEEQLDTETAETLEQEYNRMDTCIRRIIRVVKVLPYFNDIGKPAQLSVLRSNIYGLIVLYSSFFFEPGIRKLRYPIKLADGSLSTVTVSMLDEVMTPDYEVKKTGQVIVPPREAPIQSERSCCAANLREDFELYKTNTLAAFDHLDELADGDDNLRVALLAIKLFADDYLPEEFRAPVSSSRRAYLLFLWTYLRWRAGPLRLRQASERFSRLIIAFIDLRTLEIRMTEFAKLLSLEGLSPLMREVCSQGSAFGSTRN